MKSLLRQFTAGTVALLLGCHAFGQEIRIAAQEGSTPKFVSLMIDGKPQIGGTCIDVLRAIERVDPSIHFTGDQKWMPLIRAEAGLANGVLDAACALIRTPEREAKYAFVDTPLYPVNYMLVVRANDTVQINNWQDVRDLGNQGVILTLYGYSGILSHLRRLGGLQIDEGGYDTKVNLEKLLAGRGRFFIHRSPGVSAEIAAAGLEGKVKILPTVMHSETLYMMVSMSMPLPLREKLNKALLQLASSGELSKISKKWEEHRN